MRGDRAVQPRQGGQRRAQGLTGSAGGRGRPRPAGTAGEDTLRAAGSPEVPADEVGLTILDPLKEFDVVAYLRFASVYRAFESLADFEAEITERKGLR